MSEQFKYLLSPLKIGPITVRNRTVVSSHETHMYHHAEYPEDFDFLAERYSYYVGERAKGGVGLIVLGQYGVHPTTRFEIGHPGAVAFDEGAIPGMKMCVDACHKFGAKAAVQLFHSGFHNTSGGDGSPVWSASDMCTPPHALGGEVAKPMEKEEIEDLKKYYDKSARNAMAAGADGIEIHAAHGYLLHQFLSPLWNKRSDEYGGSLENRMRLMIEVAETVRAAIGPDKMLGMRISSDDFYPGGMGLEDMKEVARRLDEHGALDYLNVSQGTATMFYIPVPPSAFPHGAFVPLAGQIREVVKKVKIFAVGRIVDPVEAEKILADGHADMVIMTRAHVADPELVNKTREGRLDEIRACLGDSECSAGDPHFSCTQNPAVGREKTLGIGTMQPAEKKKRVMVAGGGPGGMEAAWVAACRGHDVTLYEKGGELGGQVLLAQLLPMRAELNGVVRWRKTMLDKYGVKVVLNTEVTPELVAKEKPDAVVVATGSTPRRDGMNPYTYNPVPGWDSPNVVVPEDILTGKVQVGENVLVFDVEGRARGTFIALKLAEEGKSVRLAYPTPMAGLMLDGITMMSNTHRFAASGVELCPSTIIVGMQGSTVHTISTASRKPASIEGIDTVVMVGYGSSDTKLYEAIKGKVPEMYLVGDAKAPRIIKRAVWDGHAVGRQL